MSLEDLERALLEQPYLEFCASVLTDFKTDQKYNRWDYLGTCTRVPRHWKPHTPLINSNIKPPAPCVFRLRAPRRPGHWFFVPHEEVAEFQRMKHEQEESDRPSCEPGNAAL